MAKLKTEEVFGISKDILEHSYVDRGDLDESIKTYLGRNVHIALRGESKCGKSWLRQRSMPDAITVQCRLNRSVADLYTDALSQIGIKLEVERTSKTTFKATLSATQELGLKLLAKVGLAQSFEADRENDKTTKPIGHDISDIRYIADLIKASSRRLVIEDFHYLSRSERRSFAFDLKAMWDYGCYITIIGIWVESNLLLHLNPDLSGRVHEISIYWSEKDLGAVVDKGSNALNIQFDPIIKADIVKNSFKTVGILQTLVLSTLDNMSVREEQSERIVVGNKEAFESAAMHYADQLNGIYQTFAKRVVQGIRSRQNSTGIYAHTLSVIMEATERELAEGLTLTYIFRKTNARQARIQKGNLRTVLEKIDALQVDRDGRGLVMTYDPSKEEVSIVDNQLFVYRKFATVRWPWEDIIEDAGDTALEADTTNESED